MPDSAEGHSANVHSASSDGRASTCCDSAAALSHRDCQVFSLNMDSTDSTGCVGGSGPTAFPPQRGQLIPPLSTLNRVSAVKLTMEQTAKQARSGAALLRTLIPVLQRPPGVCDLETRNMAAESCAHLCGLSDSNIRLFVSCDGLQALVCESRQPDVSACTQLYIAELLSLLIRWGHAQDVFTADGVPMLGRMMQTPHSSEDRALDVDAKLAALRIAGELLPHGSARQVCSHPPAGAELSRSDSTGARC